MPNLKLPAYKKSQLIGELQSLFGDSIKDKDVVTARKRGQGTVVYLTLQGKTYNIKARVPGTAYLGLVQRIRKDARKGLIHPTQQVFY